MNESTNCIVFVLLRDCRPENSYLGNCKPFLVQVCMINKATGVFSNDFRVMGVEDVLKLARQVHCLGYSTNKYFMEIVHTPAFERDYGRTATVNIRGNNFVDRNTLIETETETETCCHVGSADEWSRYSSGLPWRWQFQVPISIKLKTRLLLRQLPALLVHLQSTSEPALLSRTQTECCLLPLSMIRQYPHQFKFHTRGRDVESRHRWNHATSPLWFLHPSHLLLPNILALKNRSLPSISSIVRGRPSRDGCRDGNHSVSY